eukprot:scaffold20176_cov62-Attheya_sp.AAC.3
MGRPLKDYVCAVIGISIGIACQLTISQVTGQWMNPIVEQCTQGDLSDQDRIEKYDLHPYKSNLGGTFVCIITQFMHALAIHSPSGLIAWGGVTLCAFCFTMIGGIEPGRVGAKGLIRYPLIISLMAQFLGVCVIMPGVWIPAYIFGGSREGGAFHPSRPFLALLSNIPITGLSIALFVIHPNSQSWSICAALLGGPFLAFLPLVYNFAPTPKNVLEMEKNRTAALQSLVKVYTLFTYLSFLGWVVLVFIALKTYGASPSNFYDGIWGEAHPAVKFMAIDTIGFFSACLLYVFLQSPSHMWKALILTPVLGPGAATCHVLKEIEATRYFIPKDEDTDKKEN